MRKDELEYVDMAKYARREAFVLRRLDHPNIVHLIEAVQSETKLFLVMEIAPGSELLQLVSHGSLPEHIARIYIRQLVGAVGYLHQKGVAHRDLKPENVIADPATYSLRLIDFGLTGAVRPDDVMRTVCGSEFYSAPEVTYNDGSGYDGTAADCWSVGVLSYILLTGVHPFVAPDGELMVPALCNGLLHFPPGLSEGASHMLRRLLDVNAARRFSMTHVSLHPWLTAELLPSGESMGGKSAYWGQSDVSWASSDHNEAYVKRMDTPNDPYFSGDPSSRVGDGDAADVMGARTCSGPGLSPGLASSCGQLPQPLQPMRGVGHTPAIQSEGAHPTVTDLPEPWRESGRRVGHGFGRSRSERYSVSSVSMSTQVDEYGEELATGSTELRQRFSTSTSSIAPDTSTRRGVSGPTSGSSSATASPRFRLPRISSSSRPGPVERKEAVGRKAPPENVASRGVEDGESSSGAVRFAIFGLGRHRLGLDARESLNRKRDNPTEGDRFASRRFRHGGLAGILSRRRGA